MPYRFNKDRKETNTMLRKKHELRQTSETFLLSAILALSGGFQDAYTYNARDEVFSNAQTGNVVLMSQHLMMGDFKIALRYLFPLIAFALGVLVEIVILFAVGFIPVRFNLLATMLVSFACSMQVQTFRKVNGYGYASTMCIGNLRSGTESLSVYLRDKEPGALRKAMHYYGIIIIFALGAGAGGVCTLHLGFKSIWISSALLMVAHLMMYKEKR